MNLYITYCGHNGDALTTRPLLKRLVEAGHDVVVGCPANHAYLFADLPVTVGITCADDRDPVNTQQTKNVLAYQAYGGDRKLANVWLGTYPDLDAKFGHNWANVVKTFNRQVPSAAIEVGEVPMLFDWKTPLTPAKRGRCVYLENGSVRSGHCTHEFDVKDLCQRFPNLTFCCISDPDWRELDGIHNVLGYGWRNLMELSRLSDSCVAAVGKGSGPFFAAFTEANRTKPRCVVGYRPLAPHKGPFWQYPGNATEYVDGTEGLYSFLEKLE